MSDSINATQQTHCVDTKPTELTEDAVANYLLQNPSFLIERSDVLLDIQVALQESGVVSLTQIQTEQYREKIKALKVQLEKLLNNARNNEVIYKTYASLNLALAKASSLTDIDSILKQYIVDELSLEAFNLVLLGNTTDHTESQPFLSELQHHAMFEKKLAKSPFYLGRLGKLEKETLFPNNEANSVVVMQIGETKAIALLVISSTDAMHFNPKIDTMLLEFLRQALNYHIARLL